MLGGLSQQLGDVRTSGTKSERRRFMSAKGGDVHKPAADRATSRLSSSGRDDGVPTRQEFLQMQREVQTYGMHPLLVMLWHVAQQSCTCSIAGAVHWRVTACSALGASALDKRSKKKFNAGVMKQLGARSEKAPRVAASIGKGALLLTAVACKWRHALPAAGGAHRLMAESMTL